MAKSKQGKPNRSRRKRAAMARRARARAAAAAAPAAHEPLPTDRKLFTQALLRRLMTFTGMPRRCRAPICRRTKRCLGPGLRCQRDHPLPKLAPVENAAVKAGLKRALERRLAEIRAAREA